MTDLTAYICKIKPDGISVENPSNNDDIDIQDFDIITKIVPNNLTIGCSTGKFGKIISNIHRNIDIVQSCNEAGDSFLRLVYQDPANSQDYTEITAKNSEKCQWVETQIAVDGTQRTNTPYGYVWAYTHVNSGGGALSDTKHNAFPNGGGENTHSLTDNFIVPGMRIRLNHVFSDSFNTFYSLVVFDYYQTPYMTGGQIISVNKDYNNPYITYNVALAPESDTKNSIRDIVKCIPSDWIEWEIDDFVFVMKPISGHDHYTIVPFKIGWEGD